MLAIVALALAPYVNHLPLPPDDRRVPLPRFGLRTRPRCDARCRKAQMRRSSAVRVLPGGWTLQPRALRAQVAAGAAAARRSKATEEGAGHLHAVKLFETTQADVNLEAERTSGVAAAADSLSRK